MLSLNSTYTVLAYVDLQGKINPTKAKFVIERRLTPTFLKNNHQKILGQFSASLSHSPSCAAYDNMDA